MGKMTTNSSNESHLNPNNKGKRSHAVPVMTAVLYTYESFKTRKTFKKLFAWAEKKKTNKEVNQYYSTTNQLLRIKLVNLLGNAWVNYKNDLLKKKRTNNERFFVKLTNLLNSLNINPSLRNVVKWSDTLQKSCNK